MTDKGNISRRAALRGISVIGAVTAIGTSSLPQISRAASKVKAFALIGDRFHNSDYIRTALSKTIGEEAGVSIDFTDEVKMLSAETLKNYKMFILFRDGMLWPSGYIGHYPGYVPGTSPPIVSDPPLPKIEETPKMWMSAEQGKAVKNFVQNGGVALCYHNCTHVALSNPDFLDVLGASYIGHPELRPFKVEITNKNHPITRGVNDFVVTDEQHFFKYVKDQKNVFMKSINTDGKTFEKQGTSCEAGWAHEYGKGRVCFIAPGHMIPVLWNTEFVKVQHNAVKWLLGEI